MKIFVAHPSTIDFENDLYKPLKQEFGNDHDLFLPRDADEEVTVELLKSCDALVAEVSEPSTGSGIEMGWANAYGKPILALHKKGIKVSKAVGYTTSEIREYDSQEDLIKVIKDFIEKV